MKVFDCVTFFDEKMMLNLRFNILNKYVDKFVVVEQLYTHSGAPKKKIFDINPECFFPRPKIKSTLLEFTPKQNIIKLSSFNKEILGATAAKIRSYRKPEPFKGKGIKYENEFIFRKEGKKK